MFTFLTKNISKASTASKAKLKDTSSDPAKLCCFREEQDDNNYKKNEWTTHAEVPIFILVCWYGRVLACFNYILLAQWQRSPAAFRLQTYLHFFPGWRETKKGLFMSHSSILSLAVNFCKRCAPHLALRTCRFYGQLFFFRLYATLAWHQHYIREQCHLLWGQVEAGHSGVSWSTQDTCVLCIFLYM